MAISSTSQTIKNTAYGNRVADLEADAPNGPIIGWTQNNQENQQWNLEPQHGKEYKLSVNYKGDALYISSNAPSAGDNLVAGAESSLYTIQEHNGYYYISIHTEEGQVLYWTLKNAARGIKITLEPANNSANQLWALTPAVEN